MQKSTNQDKLVSIGLPVRNGKRFIRRALDSLLSQNYKNFELIISDNASTDDTPKICQDYTRKDRRIRYFRQPENVGGLPNFEFLLKQAKGEYFMLASDDDWWAPSFISTLKTILDYNPEYGVAMSSVKLIYEDGSLYKEVRYDGDNDLTNLDYGAVLHKMMKGRPINLFIYGLFRREFLKRLFQRARSLPVYKGGDVALICEAALVTHFYSVPEILWYRTIYHKPKIQRYLERDDFDNKSHSHYIWKAISYLITSPVIPFSRKIFLLLPNLPVFIWFNKDRLLRELISRLHFFSKRKYRGSYHKYNK